MWRERETEEDVVMRTWKTPRDRKTETEMERCYKKRHLKEKQVKIEEANTGEHGD